ncbi:hypothetical protein [Streptomyces sp. NPDC046805]|uniref:hypothetical protein n=1 Tax=Streptomyces sp. NPDC046805 TaxID=3155134 RepID=UPI0033D65A97
MTWAYGNSVADFSEPGFTGEGYRVKYPELVERRARETELLKRHLGKLPVAEPLPNTDAETVAYRAEVLPLMETWPEKEYFSLPELVQKPRGPSDDFSLADFGFIHAPGGHAPMVVFNHNAWLGEVLHLARENSVYISLICHAPIALTSTNHRVDDKGQECEVESNPFLAAEATTVSTTGETGMLDYGYVHIPGEVTRLDYFVDEGLREAGFTVPAATVPTSLVLLPNPDLGLVTPETIRRRSTSGRWTSEARSAGARSRVQRAATSPDMAPPPLPLLTRGDGRRPDTGSGSTTQDPRGVRVRAPGRRTWDAPAPPPQPRRSLARRAGAVHHHHHHHHHHHRRRRRSRPPPCPTRPIAGREVRRLLRGT